jgi:Mn-containing catalase
MRNTPSTLHRCGTCPTAHGQDGAWASGPEPGGQHEFGYLADPKPLGDVASVPAPDPLLYATYDGSMGKPSGPALGTEIGLTGKVKDALS